MSQQNKIKTSRYTVMNFIPLNLYKQLRKPATCFFCVTLLLVCIPAISPFSPWSYMIAVMIVVGISMIKDGVEDYKKHLCDREMNEKRCQVVRENRKVSIAVMDLEAGDVLISQNHEEIPADVVLLQAKSRIKNEDFCTSYCFINTANLDGESNLKKKIAILDPVCNSSRSKISNEIEKNNKSCNSKHNETVDRSKNSKSANSRYNKTLYKTNNSEYSEIDNSVSSTNNIVSSSICDECIDRINLEKWNVKESGDSFDEFECMITLKDLGEFFVGPKNVLLRGSIVRNTEYVVSGVVAVGDKTKQARSMEFGRTATSVFRRRLDEMLLIIGVLYCVMLCGTIICGAVVRLHSKYDIDGGSTGGASRLVFSNYILYSYLVPLSLYVMIEICRFTHALFIKNDQRMRVDNISSVCHSSEVIEDMGMIEYVLMDKTGTITKNSMTLKALHLAGENTISDANTRLSDIRNNSRANPITNDNTNNNQFTHFELFLAHLLINNSVEVIRGQYEGVSQDELSFLKALQTHGYILGERDKTFITVHFGSHRFRVEVIHTVDFTSQRQSMTSIVRLGSRYYIFCKGSDQRLLCGDHERTVRERLKWRSEYRLLVMKYLCITETQLRTILGLASDAVIADSYEALAASADAIAQRIDSLISRMRYQGATFIKDELQEDAAATIGLLRSAGIHLWMVTGDKRETAVACACGSDIISEPTGLETGAAANIDSATISESSTASKYTNTTDSKGLYTESVSVSKSTEVTNNSLSNVIAYDGRSAVAALEDALLLPNSSSASIFFHPSVVVYRATPYQKGKIAQLIVRAGKNVLSIGDGNNDVGMLREATVGVGIIGKEGTQASLAGDFAIPQFRLLKYLILSHGRYNLIRYSKIAINSYYKNLIFIGLQFFFNFFNAGSGKPIYNSFFMNYYNIIFTSLVPLVTAILDRDISERAIFLHPETYAQAKLYFSRRMIFLNIVAGFLQSATIFFVFYLFLFYDFSSHTGKVGAYLYTSTFFSIVIFMATLVRQINSISFFNLYSYFSIAISFIFFFLFILWVHLFESSARSTIYSIFIIPMFYLLFVAALGIIFIFDTVITLFSNNIISNYKRVKLS